MNRRFQAEPRPSTRFDVDTFLAQILRKGRQKRAVTEIHTLPAQPARYGEYGDLLAPTVERALRARGIARPYSHQEEAWRHLNQGEDLVIVTPTASGKTLCYYAPLLSMLEADGEGSALLLYPTKALAQDQCAELNELLVLAEHALQAYVYDGDTPNDIRRRVRSHGRLILTNPDMLHQAILPHHEKWRRLFSTLRYIVIDETHMYRGVFGSHVANVLRRLLRICAHYGQSPQIVCTSATIANPVELVTRLTGRTPHAITHSGAASGEKRLVFYNPPLRDHALKIRQSPQSAAHSMLRRLVPQGASSITFCRSRRSVETLTRRLREGLEDRGHAALAQRVEGYRGGYLPEERRRIERNLRAGHTQAVITTNALELGVDIGALDVCLLAGYPGTIASTWQQAGRAGRRQQTALIVFIAGDTPVDQYIVRHPEFFLDATPEHALIDPNNLRIYAEHLKCAIFELPLKFDEGFGDLDVEDVQDIAAWLSEQAQLFTPAHNAWHWSSENYPATSVSLRDIADENFVIINEGGDRPEVVGEIDFVGAHQTVYEKAIYIHGGKIFEVQRLDYENRKAYIRPVNPEYYTSAIAQSRVFVLDTFETVPVGNIESGCGEVRVAVRYVGYKKIRFKTAENIGYGEILLPDLEKHTTAFWLSFPEASLHRIGLSSAELESALIGVSKVLHTVAVVHAMCDTQDLEAVIGTADGNAWIRQGDATLLQTLGEPVPLSGVDGETPAIFLYDTYPGGTGLSEKLFGHTERLVLQAISLIEGCDCAKGCPTCVGPDAPDIETDVKVQTLRLLRGMR